MRPNSLIQIFPSSYNNFFFSLELSNFTVSVSLSLIDPLFQSVHHIKTTLIKLTNDFQIVQFNENFDSNNT